MEPSKDMHKIVRQFQQDVENVLENEAKRRDVEEPGMRCDIFGNDDLSLMYPYLKEAGQNMMCSIVEHLQEQGLLSILQEKTGSDYWVFCEFK